MDNLSLCACVLSQFQSCLYQFTSMELLMGNNKLLCENCTEKKQKYQKETTSAGKYLA